MATATPTPAALARDPLYLRGVGLVLLAGCFFSLGGILIRLVEAASEWQILFYRSLALLLALLLVLALRKGRALLAAFRAAGLTAAVGGLCLSAGFTCFIFSLTHTTVANTLFLLSASPFLAAVLGWLVLGEGVRRATWLTMAIAMGGVGVMVADGFAGGDPFGDLTALGAALTFAGFTVALRRGRAVDMLPTVCLAALFTLIIAGAMAQLTGAGLSVSARDLALASVMGAVQIGAGLFAFTLGSRHVPAAELALLSLSEVVLGPIWVWLGIGEVPSGSTLLGGAILLGAIVGNASSGLRRWRPPLGAV